MGRLRGRSVLMKKFSFSLFITTVMFNLLSFKATGNELTVINVKRNIPLSDQDEIYRDFYIGGADISSLKKDLVVTATRKIQIRDASGANSLGEVEIPVGQLRVIATYNNLAVAREYKLLSREQLPLLEQTGLMVGDRIEIKNSFIDKSYKNSQ